MSFFVIGSVSQDTIIHVDSFPQTNGESLCLNRVECHGGGGANVAVYLKSIFKKQTFIVSCVGSDHAGSLLIKKLHDAGVNTDMVKQVKGKHSTKHSIIFDRHDNRTTYVCSGAMEYFDAKGLNQIVTERENDSLVISPLRPASAINVFKILKNSSLRVFWNPGASMLDSQKEFFNLIPKVYCLTLNMEESLNYCNCDDVFRAAQHLLRHGLETLAITLGRNGSLVFHGNSYIYTPAINVQSASSVGCGDAFMAGFSGALTRGDTLASAAMTGNLLGAFMSMQPSMIDPVPLLEEVKGLMSMGFAPAHKKYLSSTLFRRTESFSHITSNV